MRLLELFCGLGGWSKAAIAQGHEVIGIDIVDHGYCGRLIRDALPWRDDELMSLRPDAVLASPPCEEYARRHLPWIAQVGPIDERLLRWSVGLAGRLGVPVIVECSRFAARHVPGARFVGRNAQWALWGDLPALLPDVAVTKDRLRGFRSVDEPHALRAARAAEIPFELSSWVIEYLSRRVSPRVGVSL